MYHKDVVVRDIFIINTASSGKVKFIDPIEHKKSKTLNRNNYRCQVRIAYGCPKRAYHKTIF